jgi:hypothetical protein
MISYSRYDIEASIVRHGSRKVENVLNTQLLADQFEQTALLQETCHLDVERSEDGETLRRLAASKPPQGSNFDTAHTITSGLMALSKTGPHS